jgi:hypothetical protein
MITVSRLIINWLIECEWKNPVDCVLTSQCRVIYAQIFICIFKINQRVEKLCDQISRSPRFQWLSICKPLACVSRAIVKFSAGSSNNRSASFAIPCEWWSVNEKAPVSCKAV